jgi:hypothetical protein
VRQHDKSPVARDEGLLVEQVGDETVVFDSESKEAHCLSALAAVVFAHCDGRTTVDELARLASERLDEPVDADRVMDALAQLEERDLMEPRAPSKIGVSRRTMLQRTAALGGAVAASPLITSVIAPTSAAAVTPGCGVFPTTVLCCPCGRTGTGNKQDCCQFAQGTLQCVCVKAEGTEVNPFDDKWCKPSGVPAEGTATCIGTGTQTCAVCCGNQAHPENCNLTSGVNCTGPVPADCSNA